MADVHKSDNDASIERLIAQSRSAGTDISRRAARGEGPAKYVMQVMQTYDIVHAIWRDPSIPGGYGHRIISKRPGGRTVLPREATFEVEAEKVAEWMERDFGYGRIPARPDWVLLLRVRYPDGGLEPDGRPKTMLVADMGPMGGRAMRALGLDVRDG